MKKDENQGFQRPDLLRFQSRVREIVNGDRWDGLAAAWLLLVLVWSIRTLPSGFGPSDWSEMFLPQAWNLQKGNGILSIVDTDRPAGYSAILAILSPLTGGIINSAHLVAIVCGLGLLVVAYLYFRKITGSMVACAALILMVTGAGSLSPVPLTDVPFAFFLWLSLWLATKDKAIWLMLAGFSGGLAMSIRWQGMVLPVAIIMVRVILWRFSKKKCSSWQREVGLILAYIACWGVLAATTMYVNQLVFGGLMRNKKLAVLPMDWMPPGVSGCGGGWGLSYKGQCTESLLDVILWDPFRFITNWLREFLWTGWWQRASLHVPQLLFPLMWLGLLALLIRRQVNALALFVGILPVWALSLLLDPTRYDDFEYRRTTLPVMPLVCFLVAFGVVEVIPGFLRLGAAWSSGKLCLSLAPIGTGDRADRVVRMTRLAAFCALFVIGLFSFGPLLLASLETRDVSASVAAEEDIVPLLRADLASQSAQMNPVIALVSYASNMNSSLEWFAKSPIRTVGQDSPYAGFASYEVWEQYVFSPWPPSQMPDGHLPSGDLSSQELVYFSGSAAVFRNLKRNVLATGSTWQASSEQKGFEATLAGDDDPTSGWRSAAHSRADTEETLIMTLSGIQTINRLWLMPWPGDQGYPEELRIEVSRDGQTWTELSVKQESPSLITLHQIPRVFSFDAVPVCYMRITGSILNPDKNKNYWMGFTEVRASYAEARAPNERHIDYDLSPTINVDQFGVMTAVITNTGTVTTSFDVDVLVEDALLHLPIQPLRNIFLSPIGPGGQETIYAILSAAMQRSGPFKVQLWVDRTGASRRGRTVLEQTLVLPDVIGQQYEAENFVGVTNPGTYEKTLTGWSTMETNPGWSGGFFATTSKVGAVITQSVNLAPGCYVVSLRAYNPGNGGRGALAVRLGEASHTVEMNYAQAKIETIQVPFHIDRPVDHLTLETVVVPQFTGVLVDCVVIQPLSEWQGLLVEAESLNGVEPLQPYDTWSGWTSYYGQGYSNGLAAITRKPGNVLTITFDPSVPSGEYNVVLSVLDYGTGGLNQVEVSLGALMRVASWQGNSMAMKGLEVGPFNLSGDQEWTLTISSAHIEQPYLIIDTITLKPSRPMRKGDK